MAEPTQKIVQYLNEARATELALTRVLQSQIAITPAGSYRSGLESAHKNRAGVLNAAERDLAGK